MARKDGLPEPTSVEAVYLLTLIDEVRELRKAIAPPVITIQQDTRIEKVKEVPVSDLPQGRYSMGGRGKR